ncbi:hypothetical protein [Mucilaginibacter flavidus]|uniref:hypothetical protein n=1 Tax=Mucilaginibacter flavidus TaxID=2949309 RepID=UPI002092D07D|nr:hypothetical protein [Mucilaginibacter flavidus]MCO5945416.1 hypothetical protein [Mucilaginibacter flavidus]
MRTVYLFFLFIFPAMFSSNNNIVNTLPYNSNVQAKSTEDVLMDKLFNLPEVQQLGRQLKKNMRSKVHVSILTDTSPTKENPYYELSAGYDGPDRFETRYNFRIKESDVRKSDFEAHLKVLETVSGNYIPLHKFRLVRH